MAVVFFLASIAFLSYMLSGEIEGTDQGIVARVTRFIPLQSVKIVIVVWQILTQVSRTATVFRRGRLQKSTSNKKPVWTGYARKSVHVYSPKTVFYFYSWVVYWYTDVCCYTKPLYIFTGVLDNAITCAYFYAFYTMQSNYFGTGLWDA